MEKSYYFVKRNERFKELMAKEGIDALVALSQKMYSIQQVHT